MYAIVQHGGHQYRVASGDRLVVDRLPDDVGAVIALEPVLLVSDGDGVRTGGAGLEGVRVAATVVSHSRGKKLRILTYKPKKRHRRTLGFRADLTELKVEGVLARGEALPASQVAVPEPEPAAEAAEALDAEAAPDTAAKPARSPARSRRAAAPIAEVVAGTEAVAPAAGEAPKVAAKPAKAAPRSRRVAAAATAEPEPAAAGTAEEVPQAAARPARPRRTAPAAAEAGAVPPAAEEASVKRRRAPRAARGPAASSDTEV
jgi:large subunit ribosomal protein L21